MGGNLLCIPEPQDERSLPRFGVGLWERLIFDTSMQASQARATVNTWLGTWPIKDDTEILNSLQSREAFEGALWEVFVCWELTQLGYEVQKIPRSSERTPDFRVSGPGQEFIVEATTIQPAVEVLSLDNAFNAILNALDTFDSGPLYLVVSLESAGSKEVLPDEFVTQLRNCWHLLEDLNHDSKIELEAFEWRISVSGASGRPPGHGSIGVVAGRAVLYEKLQKKLSKKIETKEGRYTAFLGPLPLVIFVQESAASLGDSTFRRMNVLYGQEAVQIPIGGGTAEGIRLSNGLFFDDSAYLRERLAAVVIASPFYFNQYLSCDLETWVHPSPQVTFQPNFNYDVLKAVGSEVQRLKSAVRPR